MAERASWRGRCQ